MQRRVLMLMLILLLVSGGALGKRVSLPDFSSSVFAAEIVGGTYKLGGVIGDVCARPMIGAPPCSAEEAMGCYVNLPRMRSVIVRMAKPFIAGVGIDVRIYELGDGWGGCDEPFAVYASPNGEEWKRLYRSPGPGGSRAYVPFELEGADGVYEYIKLVGLGGDCEPEGPEIIAVEALHPLND